MKKLIFLSPLLLLSSCSLFQPAQQDQVTTLHYRCGTLPLTVQQDNSKAEVSLIMDGKPLTLKQQVAASGTRYGDGQYVFWSKGDSAFIERNDKIIANDCILQNSG